MKFLLSIHYIFWLIISAMFFAGGEFLSKKFALNPKVSFLVLIMLTYGLSELTWLPAIVQKNSLSITGTIWSVLSLCITVLIGILVFGEKLTKIGIAGIITALISIILLSIR